MFNLVGRIAVSVVVLVVATLAYEEIQKARQEGKIKL